MYRLMLMFRRANTLALATLKKTGIGTSLVFSQYFVEMKSKFYEEMFMSYDRIATYLSLSRTICQLCWVKKYWFSWHCQLHFERICESSNKKFGVANLIARLDHLRQKTQRGSKGILLTKKSCSNKSSQREIITCLIIPKSTMGGEDTQSKLMVAPNQ